MNDPSAQDRDLESRARELFADAVEKEPSDRERYIAEQCGPDRVLSERVVALLDAYVNAGSIIPAAPAHDGAGEPAAGAMIGPYCLLEPIGEGGFGVVWLAERREPMVQRVALKILKPGMDSREVLARFEQERQALAVMNHPNVAKVLDAGTTERGLPYFVMEHVPGEPVTVYCDRRKLTIKERLELFIPVCEAVQHAHHKGIIHRDVKPSNVLVATHEGRTVPKVIDFGVAKAVSHALTEKAVFTEQGRLIGTPEYMSPEQAEMGATDIDTRTDVYSLGVVLYELLAGVLPFDPRTLRSKGYGEIQRIIREVDPPKPSARLSALQDKRRASAGGPATGGPAAHARGSSIDSIASSRRTDERTLTRALKRELDWIPLKAIRKDRGERYATPMGLAKDIQRYLDGEPLEAGPEFAVYRLRKLVMRNKGAVAAGALVVLALVAGLTTTLWQARQTRREAAAARLAESREKERADQLNQVSDFQDSMLSQVDPTEAGRRLTEDVTRKFQEGLAAAGVPEVERPAQIEAFANQWKKVNATDAARDLIDATILRPAVIAIDERFNDQPILDARLRQALADLCRDLGLYDRSFSLQERALETRRRVLGEEHPDTLVSISKMGVLLQAQGKLAEAEPYHREALEKCRRVLGEEHPDTIGSVSNVGALLQAQGKLAEAEPYFREVMEKSRRVLGEEHSDTLTCINNMGVLLQAQGKLAEAEPYFREVLGVKRRVLGEEHPSTLISINNMAYLLRAQGKLAESEPYYREALEKFLRVLGEEHPNTLVSLNNMGLLLQAQEKLAEAEPCLREVLEKRRRVLGEEHPSTLKSINNLGSLLDAQGKLAEAEPYYREALEKRRHVLGEEHPDTLVSMSTLGSFLRARGNLVEAEPYSRGALEKQRRVLGEEHPDTLTSINIMGALLLAQDKPGEAVELLAPAEAAARKVFTGANAGDLARLLTILGRSRAALPFDLPRFALAESNLLEAHPILVKARGQKHEHTRDCLKGLVALYQAWDKAEPGKGCDAKAAEWKARLDALNEPEQSAPEAKPVAR